MNIQIVIPTPLRTATEKLAEVTVEAEDVQGALNALYTKYPLVKERICKEDGELRRFINVYLNEEDVRYLQNEKSAVKDGDVIYIIPAIAGGI